jgi:hypothetical protein
MSRNRKRKQVAFPVDKSVSGLGLSSGLMNAMIGVAVAGVAVSQLSTILRKDKELNINSSRTPGDVVDSIRANIESGVYK